MSIAPTDTYLSVLSDQTPTIANDRLVHLVGDWLFGTYGILWAVKFKSQTTATTPNLNTTTNNGLVLEWVDGYYKPNVNASYDGSSTSTSTTNHHNGFLFYSLSSITKYLDLDDHTNFQLTRIIISQNYAWLTSNNNNNDEYKFCSRAIEATIHGIHTIVFIPIRSSEFGTALVELGATDFIEEDINLIQATHTLFSSDLTIAVAPATTGNDQMVLDHSTTPSGHLFDLIPRSKRRLKKKTQVPSSSSSPPTMSHVEAERQRRDKLNQRFYELRAAVPYVSKMDRASLLGDAVSYINELKTKLTQLKAQINITASHNNYQQHNNIQNININMNNNYKSGNMLVNVDVKILLEVGEYAIVQVVSPINMSYWATKLMTTLNELHLNVHHATSTIVDDMGLHLVVVKQLPDEFRRNVDGLRAAIFNKLQ